ncbi:MAG: hypothetical protein ACTHN7_05975 [Solirubrobacterales bacterium]
MATKAKAKSSAGQAKANGKGAVKKKAATLDAGASAAMAGKEALAGTRAAGKALSTAASSARLPLIAGGSLVAGLSGGLVVLKHRRNGPRRSAPNFDLGAVVDAAQKVGAMGEEVGRIASAVQGAAERKK